MLVTSAVVVAGTHGFRAVAFYEVSDCEKKTIYADLDKHPWRLSGTWRRRLMSGSVGSVVCQIKQVDGRAIPVLGWMSHGWKTERLGRLISC